MIIMIDSSCFVGFAVFDDKKMCSRAAFRNVASQGTNKNGNPWGGDRAGDMSFLDFERNKHCLVLQRREFIY